MLTRIAESLFWIGRYIERSDGTARILDVHLQLLLEDPWIDEDTACRSLLSVMGSEANDDVALGRDDVIALLAVDRTHPASIAHSIAVGPRERPPRPRDRLDRAVGGPQPDERADAAARRLRQDARVLPLGARPLRARHRRRRLRDEPRRGVALLLARTRASNAPT